MAKAKDGTNRGGKRAGAGRPKTELTLPPPPLRGSVTAQEFAQTAMSYSIEALHTLYHVMTNSESDMARVSAADKILDRAVGKAPQNVDVRSVTHTNVVYKSLDDIRAALLEVGMPPLLIDATINNNDVYEDAAENTAPAETDEPEDRRE